MARNVVNQLLFRCEIFYDNRVTETRILDAAQIKRFKKSRRFKERGLTFKRLERIQVRTTLETELIIKKILQ